MKRKLKVILLVCIVLSLCGCSCSRAKTHSYNEMLRYVNNLKCTNVSGVDFSCNLKGNCEVISDESTGDDEGREIRTLTFQVNNTGLTFDVTSAYKPSVVLDGSNLQSSYQLFDNFEDRAFEYYIDEYSRSVGYNYELNNEFLGETVRSVFDIETQNDLDFALGYIDGFLGYVNGIDIKFISGRGVFTLYFPAREDSLHISWDYKNGEYEYYFYEDAPADTSLKSYVDEYLDSIDLF